MGCSDIYTPRVAFGQRQSNVTIRPATEKDLEAISIMIQQGSREHGVETTLEGLREVVRTDLQRSMDKPGSSIARVATLSDGTIVGYAGTDLKKRNIDGQMREIVLSNGLYVVEGHQRKGIGKILMLNRSDWAKEKGLDTVYVPVHQNATKNQKLFQKKWGFNEIRNPELAAILLGSRNAESLLVFEVSVKELKRRLQEGKGPSYKKAYLLLGGGTLLFTGMMLLLKEFVRKEPPHLQPGRSVFISGAS